MAPYRFGKVQIERVEIYVSVIPSFCIMLSDEKRLSTFDMMFRARLIFINAPKHTEISNSRIEIQEKKTIFSSGR